MVQSGDDQTDLIRKIAQGINRLSGNVPTHGVSSAGGSQSIKGFSFKAHAGGATINTITTPNHAGESLNGAEIGGGDTLDVYFTQIDLTEGSGVAYLSQIDE